VKTASIALLVSIVLVSPAHAQEVSPVTTAAAPQTTVAPGKVHWHASLTEAVQAAKDTGKPILHFELLGRLDQEFC
jgi:hypothetical protein